MFSKVIPILTDLNNLKLKGFSLKKVHDVAKLESIEEEIVTVALETILVNANWLFPTNPTMMID